MGYKFVVDYYYVEGVVAFSSEFGHGGFVHPTGSKLFSMDSRTRVDTLHWSHPTLTAFIVREGEYDGKVLWVEKEKVMREYK
jgi:hypothetical protein